MKGSICMYEILCMQCFCSSVMMWGKSCRKTKSGVELTTFKNRCGNTTEEIHITSKNSKTLAGMKHHENFAITAPTSLCARVCVWISGQT